MPLITIDSPRREDLDVPDMLLSVSQDIERETGIPQRGLKLNWREHEQGYFVSAGRVVTTECHGNEPNIFVDILGPDDQIYCQFGTSTEAIIELVASCLADRIGIPRTNVFVNYRQVQSGQIYEAGCLQEWNGNEA